MMQEKGNKHNKKNFKVADNAAKIVAKKHKEQAKKREKEAVKDIVDYIECEKENRIAAAREIFEGLKSYVKSSDEVYKSDDLFMYVDKEIQVKGKFKDHYFYARRLKKGDTFIKFVNNYIMTHEAKVGPYVEKGSAGIGIDVNFIYAEIGWSVCLDKCGDVKSIRLDKKKLIDAGKQGIAYNPLKDNKEELIEYLATRYCPDASDYKYLDIRKEIDSKQAGYKQKESCKR